MVYISVSSYTQWMERYATDFWLLVLGFVFISLKVDKRDTNVIRQ